MQDVVPPVMEQVAFGSQGSSSPQPLLPASPLATQVVPSPVYPESHVQTTVPDEALQVACTSQPPLSTVHGPVTSGVQVLPSPTYPPLQAQVASFVALTVQVAF